MTGRRKSRSRRRKTPKCPKCNKIKCPGMVKTKAKIEEPITPKAQWKYIPFPKADTDELRKTALSPELPPRQAQMMRRKVIFNKEWEKTEALGKKVNDEFDKVEDILCCQHKLPNNMNETVKDLRRMTQRYYQQATKCSIMVNKNNTADVEKIKIMTSQHIFFTKWMKSIDTKLRYNQTINEIWNLNELLSHMY